MKRCNFNFNFQFSSIHSYLGFYNKTEPQNKTKPATTTTTTTATPATPATPVPIRMYFTYLLIIKVSSGEQGIFRGAVNRFQLVALQRKLYIVVCFKRKL